MNTHTIRSDWARNNFLPLLGKQCEIKSVIAEHGDFGDLDGFQFDSDQFGGFLYFWSSGMVEFHLVNYESGIEIIPITARNIEVEESMENVLKLLINKIVELKGSGELPRPRPFDK